MTVHELEGPRIFAGEDMKEGLVFSFASGHAAVVTSVGPDGIERNEDAAALIPYSYNSGVMVVADGVGGSPAGAQASRIALQEIQKAVVRARKRKTRLRNAIIDGLEKGNRSVMALGYGAATTVAAFEIKDGTVRPYHVGDSEMLVVSVRGTVKIATLPHSPIGYAVESGLLDHKEAIFHEDRNLISNVVGSSDMRIEIGAPMDLAAMDTALVASDGLFDNLLRSEIVERIRKGTIEEVMSTLATDALDRMTHPQEGVPSKPDNMTFIVFRAE